MFNKMQTNKDNIQFFWVCPKCNSPVNSNQSHFCSDTVLITAESSMLVALIDLLRKVEIQNLGKAIDNAIR